MPVRKRRADQDYDGPTFGSVWKIVTGIASAVVAAGFLAVFGWAWSLQNDMVKIIGAVENNAKSIDSINTRVDHLQDVDTTQTATIATQQAQIGNLGNTQATSAISLSERIRAMEQQNMWRERMQQPNRDRGR